jgi:hypothetical protein
MGSIVGQSGVLALETRYAVLGYTYSFDDVKRSTVARREE